MAKKLTNNKNKKVNVSNIDINKVNVILLILFLISITVLLFFRGGYFEKEYLINLIAVFLIFVVFLVVNLKNSSFKLLENPIDILFFGIVIMYLLSMTYGVNKRLALIEFSKYLGFFAIYIMARFFSKNKRYEGFLIDIILLGGLVVSLIGIGAATGTWDIPGALTGGRVSSTLQYPNTLAAYVSALYFLGLTRLINRDKKIIKGLYGCFLGTFLFTLIVTYSRAMWLMFPIVVLLFFILIPNKRKLETLLYMISSAIMSLPNGFIFASSTGDPSSKLWIYCIIASLGTGLIIYLISLGERKYREISIKKLVITLGVLAIAMVSLVAYAIGQTTEIKLENVTGEAKTSSLTRNITKTLPSTSYRLVFDYTGENKSEAVNIGRIQINNMDSKSDTKMLTREDVLETKGEGIMNFTTEEDSVGIAVHFQNIQPYTSITFHSAKLIDASTGKVISDIPLKYEYIPENIVRRLTSINAAENSFVARMRFNLDGLKILKDYAIFGTGGGGWVSLYQKYQSHLYWTTLAHNYFLQLWIEIGTIGFLLLLSMLVLISVYALKTYKKSENSKQKSNVAGLYVTIFAILLHALVDFDMSLIAYAMVFWTLMGLLVGNIEFNSTKLNKFMNKCKLLNTKTVAYILVLASVIIAVNSYRILSSAKYMKLGVEANEKQDVDALIDNYEKASDRDSLKSTIKIDLANAYKVKYDMTQDASYIQRGMSLVDEYIGLDPFNSVTAAYGSQFYISIGQFDKGLELLERSVELQPMRIENYIQKIDGYLSIFGYYYELGDYNSALVFLQKSLTVKSDVKEVNERAFKPLSANEDLVKTIGKAEYLLKNYDRLDEINKTYGDINLAYYFDIDINNDGNLDMLKSSIPKGSKLEYESLIEEDSFIRVTNEGDVYGYYYVHPLSLVANTEYVVELKARGTIQPQTFNLYAWSNGSTEPNQGGLAEISLSNDWQTYTFEFTTNADVTPGNQYIRIQHNGNDNGYIDVKDLAIFEK